MVHGVLWCMVVFCGACGTYNFSLYIVFFVVQIYLLWCMWYIYVYVVHGNVWWWIVVHVVHCGACGT